MENLLGLDIFGRRVTAAMSVTQYFHIYEKSYSPIFIQPTWMWSVIVAADSNPFWIWPSNFLEKNNDTSLSVVFTQKYSTLFEEVMVAYTIICNFPSS